MTDATVAAPLPTLAEVHPIWKRVSDKVNTLCKRRDAIHVQLQALEWIIGRQVRYHSTSTVADVEVKPKPPAPLSEAAAALIGDDSLMPDQPSPTVSTEKPKPVVTYQSAEMQQRATLAAELTAIEDALKVLQPQLAKAHQDGSRALCRLYEAEYAKRAGRVAGALIELATALRWHREYTQALTAQGADWLWHRPVDVATLFELLGDPADSQSEFRRWFVGAAEAGHFDLADLPREWTRTPDQESRARGVLPVAPAQPVAQGRADGKASAHLPAPHAPQAAPEQPQASGLIPRLLRRVSGADLDAARAAARV